MGALSLFSECVLLPESGEDPAEVAEDALDEVDDFRLEFDETGVRARRCEWWGEDMVRCWSGC